MFIYKTCSTICFNDGYVVVDKAVNIEVVTVDGRGALRFFNDCRVEPVICPACGVRQIIHICTRRALEHHRKERREKGGD